MPEQMNNQYENNQQSNHISSRLVWWIIGLILAVAVIAGILILSKEEPAPALTQLSPSQQASKAIKTYPGKIVLSADSQTVLVGEEVGVEIRLDTQGININLAKVVLSFDPAMLEIKTTDFTGSVLPMQARLDESVDQVAMSRGVGGDGKIDDSDDGFTGSAGLFGKVVLTAKAKGAARVGLSPDSKMFLDDGRGTAMELTLDGVIINIE